MNEEVMNTVLTEILQEQKALNDQKRKDSEMLVQLSRQIQNLEERLLGLKSVDLVPETEPLNTAPLEDAISKGVESLKEAVNSKPKVVMLAKRYLLFPEGKIEQYYKVIFGGLFKGLVILIVGVFFLTVLNRYIREREYLHYKKAWQMLYNNQKEEGKQFLERVWKDCDGEEKQPLNKSMGNTK